jgi:hypothetical protein
MAEEVTRECVIIAAKSILGEDAYNNVEKSSGCPMAWNLAAVKMFINETLPYAASILRQGLRQLERDGYLK